MAKLVLHIGTPKTGSTYLQHWLKLNVTRLREQGWGYPTFIDSRNHRNLALLFEGIITPYYEFTGLGSEEALAAEKQRWTDGLSATVARDSKWIITSEFFTQCLGRSDQIQPLIDFLRVYFDEIHIVCFVRRQEYFMPSMYSQNVKAGAQPEWSWEYCKTWTHLIDYNAMYDRWNHADGVSSVTMIPFLEANKVSSNAVVEQFSQAAGIRIETELFERATLKSNPSLSAEGLAFLKTINPHLPRVNVAGHSNRRIRARVIAELMKIAPGPTFNPADGVVDAVRDYYLSSNTELATRLRDDPRWDAWLNQPTHDSRIQQPVPTLSAERTAELMIALSEPKGPIAWGEADLQPIPPVPFRELTKQKVAQRIQRLRRAGAK